MTNRFNMLDCVYGQPQVNKFGLNSDMDSGSVPEDVWTVGGVLNDQAIVAPVSMVSTSFNDNASGPGMRTVRVEGIDTNGDFKTSDHTLNGTTPVNIGNYLFVNRAYGLTWGLGRKNAGTINFIDNGGAGTISQIAVDAAYGGYGQTLQAIFCIPRDWGAMVLKNRRASIGRQAATAAAVLLSINKHGALFSDSGFRVSDTMELNAQGTTFADEDIVPNCNPIEALNIVRLTVIEITTNNTRVSGGFGLAKA